jgi:RimJ/RimL family protein N-acetyltransferase
MPVVLLDDVVVGHLYLHVEDAWSQVEVKEQATRSQAEVGWAFDPAHQGRGYATEAVQEALRICFEDLGVRRVVALAFADNGPSLRVMEKVGMRREALMVKESLHRELGWLDGVSYGLLAEEWLSSR